MAKRDPQAEKGKPVYNEEQKELIKVATLLQKKGLKEKDAVSNRQRVYYFRADAFHEKVLENKEEILKICSKHVKLDQLETVQDSMQLGDIFINNKLLRCFNRVPDEPQKYKYPKKLIECKTSMNEKGFYGFEIHKNQTKMTILAIMLAVAIIAIILFPLWPYSVKLGIFNVLFYFSAGMLSLIALRLIIYLVIFPFGVSFWIFPNMLSDDLGIIESFFPFLLVNVREDGWPLFFFRMLMILCFAAY